MGKQRVGLKKLSHGIYPRAVKRMLGPIRLEIRQLSQEIKRKQAEIDAQERVKKLRKTLADLKRAVSQDKPVLPGDIKGRAAINRNIRILETRLTEIEKFEGLERLKRRLGRLKRRQRGLLKGRRKKQG